MGGDPVATEPTIRSAARAVSCAESVIQKAVDRTRARGAAALDDQVLLYELSHTAAAVTMARTALTYAETGPVELRLATVFIGRVLADMGAILWRNDARWGSSIEALGGVRELVAAATDAQYVSSCAHRPGKNDLPEDLELVRETFHRFGRDKIAPHAERIHREDLDVPHEIIQAVAELGCFGLSIPAQYGGSAEGGDNDYLAMVIATEELSGGSLGAGGSLITRPEILARALLAGGTDAQKDHWLPLIADGHSLCAVAVTEPDYGSDVASLKVSATALDDGYLLNGTKTWCTFAGQADVLMVLARTNPDPAAGHRGLSILLVEKPRDQGHAFHHSQDGGTLQGRAIPTLGYRGMHSFEVSFDNWMVPAKNLLGESEGLGRGFYLQMAGFETGRLQTAARAVGVMQRAYELAVAYTADRDVFGEPLDTYPLTRFKLGQMAATIAIARQFTYHAARLMSADGGSLEAAMAKAAICRSAEWVTREAMQLHGGYGYAEEYEVSRLFVDARVLSIFEGADETLCLKLIARKLLA